MSQRTVGLIGGIVFLVSLCIVQVLRLIEYEDRTRAVIEGATGAGVLLLAVVGVVVGRRIYTRLRWRRVAALQPRRDLLLMGEYRTAEGETLVRVGLFIDEAQLILQPVEEGAAHRPIDLSEVRRVSVGQLDSSIGWATNLDIGLLGGEALCVTLDGWRLRSRTHLFDEASAAADRIRAAAGLAPVA